MGSGEQALKVQRANIGEARVREWRRSKDRNQNQDKQGYLAGREARIEARTGATSKKQEYQIGGGARTEVRLLKEVMIDQKG